MSIFAYYVKIIFLTNFVSGKIGGHVPPQVQQLKIGGRGRVPPPPCLMIKPHQILKATFAHVNCVIHLHFPSAYLSLISLNYLNASKNGFIQVILRTTLQVYNHRKRMRAARFPSNEIF